MLDFRQFTIGMKDRLSKKHIVWVALLGFSAVADEPDVFVAGDPRFDVFEYLHASPDATVILSFASNDNRYCRAARFHADSSFVLACRNEQGWQVEAVSRFSADNAGMQLATPATPEVGETIEALNPQRVLLNEQEIIEAAAKGWRHP